MIPVDTIVGDSPIVLGMPHTGTFVPTDILSDLNENGRALADTDWNIDRLYTDLLPGASVVKANFHRYVIDANRNPNGESLYPGQNTTELCPTTDFDNIPIYDSGKEPNQQEIERRRRVYHAPYHEALERELQRVRSVHGVAILYDSHSIRSKVPFLFEGTLPDFSIGTNGGATCAPEIEHQTAKICELSVDFTSVLNGRFKGGWTTRHYGRPSQNMHAIQMELTQSLYMEEAAPWEYTLEKAEKLRPILKDILNALEHTSRSLKRETTKIEELS